MEHIFLSIEMMINLVPRSSSLAKKIFCRLDPLLRSYLFEPFLDINFILILIFTRNSRPSWIAFEHSFPRNQPR